MAGDRDRVDAKSYTVTVRLQGRLYRDAKRSADQAGVSLSEWLRGVIQEASARQQQIVFNNPAPASDDFASWDDAPDQ